MPRRLDFSIELSDSHVKAIEVVKSLLMTDTSTGITNESSLEEVYCELANVGLAIMSMEMMNEGSYDRHKKEVELGNMIDDLLDDK